MDRSPLPALSARQVNVTLGVLLAVLFVTGVVSWAVGTGWSRALTLPHAVAGFGVVALLPRKASTSVRSGLRRHRVGRWLSATMGIGVLVTIGLGVVHSWGLWYGVGYWSALWTHTLVAFALLPLVVWHVAARPARPRRTDLDRRYLLGSGARLAGAAAALGMAEAVTRAVGSGHRRFTGSRELASFDPAGLPSVSWIDDTAPDLDPAGWPLMVAGRPIDIADLRARATPLEADLDCTGGWWSRQRWDVVPLSDVLPPAGAAASPGGGAARSIEVVSATGYRRRFPLGDADHTYLAVGYGGAPLHRRHGAPVRIVAPGRRGPWWVKWVVEVGPSNRPWWLQAPFPTT